MIEHVTLVDFAVEKFDHTGHDYLQFAMREITIEGRDNSLISLVKAVS